MKQFTKSWAELEPPKYDRSYPLGRFKADHQELNFFFWSSEIALATLLGEYDQYNDSTERAPKILGHIRSGAFTLTTTRGRPHYTAQMGSLLVQARWNYDFLARSTISRVCGSLETYQKERAPNRLGKHQSPIHFWERLNQLGIASDPRRAFQAQLYRDVRNMIAHDPIGLGEVMTEALKAKTRDSRTRTTKWFPRDPEWPSTLTRAHNEVFLSSKRIAERSDLPHMFMLAVYALSTIKHFVDDVEGQLFKAGI